MESVVIQGPPTEPWCGGTGPSGLRAARECAERHVHVSDFTSDAVTKAMPGPVAVRPTVLVPCEAWQITEENLIEVARWGGAGRGDVDGRPCVWVDLPDEEEWSDHGRPAFADQWIVKTPAGTLVLSPEEFAQAYEVVPSL